MKRRNFMSVSVLLILIVFVPLVANAGALVIGPAGQNLFEEYRTRHLDMYVDFEKIPTGLYTKLPDLPVTLNTKKIRWPLPEKNADPNTPVAVLPTGFLKTPANHRLMGVTEAKIPDGQSSYWIIFDECQDRVGLFRQWRKDYSITRFFYHDRELVEHQNNYNNEFVGYIKNPADHNDFCVTHVEIDGKREQPEDLYNQLYQVGEVDNLFFSTPSVSLGIRFDSYVEGEMPIFIPGETITTTITVKNEATYINKNIGIEVEIFSHEHNQWVTFKWLRDIPPGETLTFTLRTDTTKAEIKSYKVYGRIFSSTNNHVYTKVEQYFITPKKYGLIGPIFLPLLLRDLD